MRGAARKASSPRAPQAAAASPDAAATFPEAAAAVSPATSSPQLENEDEEGEAPKRRTTRGRAAKRTAAEAASPAVRPPRRAARARGVRAPAKRTALKRSHVFDLYPNGPAIWGLRRGPVGHARRRRMGGGCGRYVARCVCRCALSAAVLRRVRYTGRRAAASPVRVDVVCGQQRANRAPAPAIAGSPRAAPRECSLPKSVFLPVYVFTR
eukprot:1192120-Prorocentrum_minimum.AAC.2